MKYPVRNVFASAVLLCAPIAAQVTQRVNVSSTGAQSNGMSFNTICVTPDGRFIAFYSDASNLVPGDTNGKRDIFLRDRQLGMTERVSVDSEGLQANGHSNFVWSSADGRFLSFSSAATNLVPGDTNGFTDIFVRDRVHGTTERVSVGWDGSQANANCRWCPISRDGRYVVFDSAASNLVAFDTNGCEDIFLHDRRTGGTERVSLGPTDGQGNGSSDLPYISDDGRYVSFRSHATGLVPGDSNEGLDVFVRDRVTGTTERVNVSSSGEQADRTWDAGTFGMISGDGRFVVFQTIARNLVPGDTNLEIDVFVHDRETGATERVSVGSDGTEANDQSRNAAISADGRYVAFHSDARNLVPGATISGHSYVRDRLNGTTELASRNSDGVPANGGSVTVGPSISSDGRFALFDSWASNLVPGDYNEVADIFVRDRLGGTDFTSFCEPGAGGVRDCPCSNPPGGPGRGCDNSLGTGGAALAAAGGAFLSSDSLFFTTSGEKPAALSILMQGNGVMPNGVIYGQGVRCLGGTLIRRLFIAQASGGSIRVPDFGLGQSTVSARSAAKGDVIQAGGSRSYLVYYRDPVVLGGCPGSSTFNTTQTGIIDWSP